MLLMKYFVAIFMLAILSLRVQYTLLSEKMLVAVFSKINTNYEICMSLNLQLADEIVKNMTKQSPHVDCDITSDIHFVTISEQHFDDSKPKDYFHNMLKYQNNNNTFELENLSLLYSINLNMKSFIKRLNIEEEYVECTSQQFDKTFNVSEGKKTNFFSKLKFTQVSNYTLYFEKHGYFYISCYDTLKNESLIYDDSFYIFPSNMSKLVDERRQFHAEDVNKRNLTFEGKEDLQFLDVENSLKIDEKMNVLMLGIDSLSYAHFRRSMPLTHNYLNNELSTNILYTSMNVVGENTYPNILALLSGIIVEGVDSVNMSMDIDRYMDDEFYDKFPFIWFEYEKLGYLTAYQVISILIQYWVRIGLSFKILLFH
jgi:hypothetical protein